MTTPFRVTHDRETGASYIYLAGPIADLTVAHTRTTTPDILLDFDGRGQLVGIEILDMHMIHPTTLAVAEVDA